MSNQRLQWPSERFYWAVLDAPGCALTGPLPPGLHSDLEREVPPTDEPLHAVAAPAGDGRLLVCAIEQSKIDQVIAQALTPDRVPECLNAFVPAERLNLLVGEYEPRALRRAQRRRHATAAAAVVVASLLVAAGLVRRAHNWDNVGTEAVAATRSLLADVGAADAVRLDNDLKRARAAALARAALAPPPDAASAAAVILSAWPGQVPSKPQSLAITGDTAAVSVNVDGDASPFLKALRPPTGWVVEEPRLNAAGGITRVSLVMRRAPVRAKP